MEAERASRGRSGRIGRPVGRRVEVSGLRAEQVYDIARRRAREGDVHVERRGGETFLVTSV